MQHQTFIELKRGDSDEVWASARIEAEMVYLTIGSWKSKMGMNRAREIAEMIYELVGVPDHVFESYREEITRSQGGSDGTTHGSV